jgi:hypothetical protein
MTVPCRVVYALVDPRHPEQYRYVGQTRDLEYRVKVHRHHARVGRRSTRLYDWIRSVPEVAAVVLEHCETDEELNERERHWIAKLRAEGHDLLQVRAGGRYVVLTDEDKKKISERKMGWVVSDDTREKMRQSHLGHVPTAEARKNMSQAQHRRWHVRRNIINPDCPHCGTDERTD